MFDWIIEAGLKIVGQGMVFIGVSMTLVGAVLWYFNRNGGI